MEGGGCFCAPVDGEESSVHAQQARGDRFSLSVRTDFLSGSAKRELPSLERCGQGPANLLAGMLQRITPVWGGAGWVKSTICQLLQTNPFLQTELLVCSR